MSSLPFDPRYITLAFSVIGGIAAGTMYIYGVYSPQLISRCNLSTESAATISFASNIGSGLGGFPAGLIIDKFGLRISLFIGAISIMGGYGSLHWCYINATSSIPILSISIFFVGFGSIISYFSTLKACVANFPNHRGTAGVFAVSSFGLSALVFSTISAIWFSDDVQGLLKFLSLTCGFLIIFSSFFIKLYSQDEIELLQKIDEESQLVDDFNDDDEPATTTIERSQPQPIGGKKYSSLGGFLSGHRGSLAQIKFNESATSLFSYASSLMSRSSSSISTISVASESPITQNKPIQVRHNPNSINSINNTYYNSSPTSSRISNSPGTVSSSSPMDRAPSQHRDSQSKVYFGVGPSPRNSFSVLDRATLKRDIDIPAVVDEETPLIEQPKTKLRPTRKQHSTLGHLKNLIFDRVYLLHFLILAVTAAIGQLYIYSVGFIVKALFNKRDPVLLTLEGDNIFIQYLIKHMHLVQFLNSVWCFNAFDITSIQLFILVGSLSSSDPTPELYQALQVSIIAFGSFMGRLLWGPLSDIVHKSFHYQRLWLALCSCILVVCGEAAALLINDVSRISIASILIGLGYGSIYSVYPAVIAEQFGSAGFTTSWGLISTGPLVGFYFLTKLFGQNIDRMSQFIDGEYICIVGNLCYNDIFKINIGLGIFACTLIMGVMYSKR